MSYPDNVEPLMQSALPAPLLKLLETVAAEAQARDLSLHVVGGFVRDLLLGKPNLDVDLVAEGDAIGLARALQANYGGSVEPHFDFGTGTWILDELAAQALGIALSELPLFIDFVMARRESYAHPAALPTVERGTIQDDLQRRDFTINTLAIRLTPAPFGKLLDLYGGVGDLEQQIIRVLHNRSFIDDGTRMLRAARFEQRFGFQIEPDTLSLFPDALPFLQDISGHRLQTEFDLIFAEPEPERALARLDALGVLRSISGRLKFDEWFSSAFQAARWQIAQPHWKQNAANVTQIYWMILACRLDDPATLAARFQMIRTLAVQLEHGRQAHLAAAELGEKHRPSEIAQRLDGLSEAALIVAWAVAPTLVARDQIREYAARLRHIKPTITGDDLIRMGLKPGPSFGKLLNRLRQAWLDGLIASPDEERAYLQQLLDNGDGHDGD